MNPTTTHSSEVVGQLVLIETDPIRQRVKHAIAGFLAGYSGTTLEAYRLDLRGWITWLDAAFLDPFAVERAHIELYARWSESEGKARSTIGRRLSTICGFYRYCSQERLIERDPSAHVRRPKQDYESSTLGLDRNELGAFLVRKARVFAVRFPILQIDVFVGNVEVTADNDRFFCLQALQISQKGRFPMHPVVQPLQLLL